MVLYNDVWSNYGIPRHSKSDPEMSGYAATQIQSGQYHPLSPRLGLTLILNSYATTRLCNYAAMQLRGYAAAIVLVVE